MNDSRVWTMTQTPVSMVRIVTEWQQRVKGLNNSSRWMLTCNCLLFIVYTHCLLVNVLHIPFILHAIFVYIVFALCLSSYAIVYLLCYCSLSIFIFHCLFVSIYMHDTVCVKSPLFTFFVHIISMLSSISILFSFYLSVMFISYFRLLYRIIQKFLSLLVYGKHMKKHPSLSHLTP